MLRYKHLQYFGPTGSAIWHGNVYSQVRMDSFFSRPVIYHGIFGTGLFQCIYPKRYSPFAALLSSLEWLAVTLFIFFLSMPLAWLRLIPLIMFGLTLAVGLGYMAQARIETKFDSIPGGILLTFTLVTLLTLPSNSSRPITSLYLLAAVSFLALIWFIHGLRLRHRLAELVEVAAIRAGLQPLGKTKKE